MTPELTENDRADHALANTELLAQCILANTAEAVLSPNLANIVLGKSGFPVCRASLRAAMCVAIGCVLLGCTKDHVVRIDAGSNSAEMANLESIWDVSLGQNIGMAMGQDRPAPPCWVVFPEVSISRPGDHPKKSPAGTCRAESWGFISHSVHPDSFIDSFVAHTVNYHRVFC